MSTNTKTTINSKLVTNTVVWKVANKIIGLANSFLFKINPISTHYHLKKTK
jgi:hypothetical protein